MSVYNRICIIYGNSIVVVPGINFQCSGGEKKKEKNEGEYQQFPGRESHCAASQACWQETRKNWANCYQAWHREWARTGRREDGWTWSMSAHSSYPGLMWSVNVVHRNHCPPGSFCLIVHFQELKFSHKKAGLFKNKCSQIWRYSGMAVLEKNPWRASLPLYHSAGRGP